MNAPDASHLDSALALLQQQREAYEALNDDTAAHLCDLGIAAVARRMSPEAGLDAVAAPLRRMVESGSSIGLDALATQLLLLARSTDDEELEKAVRDLLVSAGRANVLATVLSVVLEEARAEREASSRERAQSFAWAALELAVAVGHWEAGAEALLLLAELYETAQEAPKAAHCMLQAATYLEKSGAHGRAGETRVRASELQPDTAESQDALAAAAESFSAAGDHERGARVLGDVARRQLASGDLRRAQKTLRRALTAIQGSRAVGYEAELYTLLAESCEQQGDEEMALNYRTRAELLAED